MNIVKKMFVDTNMIDVFFQNSFLDRQNNLEIFQIIGLSIHSREKLFSAIFNGCKTTVIY
jgi:hypothetical protein